jgi:tetratricopeptide (TPR) repeat protein
MWLRMILAALPLVPVGFAQAREAEPVEEDTDARKVAYAFNPLKAEQEIKVGDFYWKRGSFQAAAGRYKEATLWNPSAAMAFLKLGDCYEKLKERDQAKEAFTKYLALEPNGKRAAELRKRIGISASPLK